eukprot:m51a1_g12953 Sec24D (460) ;mRNA; f:113-1965
MPTGGPGALRPRDNAKLYGTDKEKTLVAPQNAFWKGLAQECAKSRVGVDVFALAHTYADVATLSDLCKLTGGQMYHYPAFDLVRDAGTVEADMRRCVLRNFGYDGSLRVRVSRGLGVTEYLGNCSPSGNELDVDIALVHADHSFAAIIKHDEKLADRSEVVVQAALLYTTSSGQRRVRVHTVGASASTTHSNVYKACDCDAVAHVMCRQAAVEVQRGNATASVASAMTDRCVDALACYRQNCTASQSSGQLILPESLRLLPLYLMAVAKSPLLRAEVTTDARVAAACALNSGLVCATQLALYPRVWPLHTLVARGAGEMAHNSLPQTVRLGVDWIHPTGVYAIDAGAHLLIWVGATAPADVLSQLFGVDNVGALAGHALTAMFYKTNFSGESESVVMTLVGQIAEQRGHSNIAIKVVKQGEAGDNVTWQLLVEDKGPGNTLSYIDYLCLVHRNIQYKLS